MRHTKHTCALPTAPDPFSPPPPNISRPGDLWDHSRTRFNVRRGGAEEGENGKKALPYIYEG